MTRDKGTRVLAAIGLGHRGAVEDAVDGVEVEVKHLLAPGVPRWDINRTLNAFLHKRLEE